MLKKNIIFIVLGVVATFISIVGIILLAQTNGEKSMKTAGIVLTSLGALGLVGLAIAFFFMSTSYVAVPSVMDMMGTTVEGIASGIKSMV